MSAKARRLCLIIAAVVAACQSDMIAQQKDENFLRGGNQDRPKVAIVQYESGRVLVVKEVNGELQVIEPAGSTAAIINRYLEPVIVSSDSRKSEGSPSNESYLNHPQENPFFFSPQWFGYQSVINVNPLADASVEDRATERAKQKAAESRQQVKARRAEQGTGGTTNVAGQAYPSSAADREESERLARVRQEAGASPYVTFYSLGGGLEYYRQQELAARRELALLTYDVLLEEGLNFFHNRQYGRAARSFIAATQKDQGDAGSRLHAAQALMACGLYTEAMVHVRRAFELSPQLIHRPLNHRDNYTDQSDYDQQIKVLKDYARSHSDDDEAWILLAYEQFFGDAPKSATRAMARVKRLAKSDGFARKLWQAARPVLGRLD